MKRTKGIFIDSSYRRAGLLKTLLQGFRHDHGEGTGEGSPDDHGYSVSSAPGVRGRGIQGSGNKDTMKRAASL